VAAAVLLRRKTRSGTTGRLYSIAVDPEFRGKGLGKALLAECLDVLRRENISACMLEVDDRNKHAIALYQKAGFKKMRLLPHYYGQGNHGWKMRLDLNKAPAPAAAAKVAGQARAVAQTVSDDRTRAKAASEIARHA